MWYTNNNVGNTKQSPIQKEVKTMTDLEIIERLQNGDNIRIGNSTISDNTVRNWDNILITFPSRQEAINYFITINNLCQA